MGKAEKRAEILFHARKELARSKGVNFSLNNVLKGFGGSKTTIYTYFGDRAGLLKAVMDDIITSKSKSTGPGGFAELSAKQILEAVAEDTHRVVLDPDIVALYRMAVCEISGETSFSKLYYNSGPKIFREMFVGLLESETFSKDFDIPNPHHAADYFFGMLLEHPLMKKLMNVRLSMDLEEFRTEAVERFIRAYKK